LIGLFGELDGYDGCESGSRSTVCIVGTCRVWFVFFLTRYLCSRAICDEQDARGGQWDRDGRLPVKPGSQGVRGLDLGLSDEESQASGGSQQTAGGGKDVGEALDGAQGDDVGEAGAEILGAAGEYIDVGQCKGADDFAEKRGFLVAGFDQRKMNGWSPEFNGQAGKAGAGAHVYDARWAGSRGSREEMAGGEQGLTEVAGDDLLGLAHGGEIDARIPAEQ